jgi:hypothetical protein
MENIEDMDKTMVAAQLHATLGTGNVPNIDDRGQFLTFIASSAEIPKDSLKENWAFHNKDIATSRLNHSNIMGIFNLHRAVKLMELTELPLSEFTDEKIRKHYNDIVATYVRAMKSIHGFTVNKIAQTTDVKVIKKDEEKIM